MIFINANILNENFKLIKQDIEIDDTHIKQLGKINYSSTDMVIDCDGFYIVPSFVGNCELPFDKEDDELVVLDDQIKPEYKIFLDLVEQGQTPENALKEVITKSEDKINSIKVGETVNMLILDEEFKIVAEYKGN